MSPQVMPGKFYRQEQKQPCLQIYQLGNEITALVNEEKPIGTHTIEFDATTYQAEFISIEYKPQTSHKLKRQFY